MILRAQITAVKDKHHCTVRIPQFNKMRTSLGATPDSELYTATVACEYGVQPALKSGDVVLVAFESGDESQPCIVGLLYNTKSEQSSSDIHITSLNVTANTVLSEDTTIGKVKKENIKCLEKLNRNVQKAFEDIDKELEEQQKDIVALDKRATDLEKITAEHAETLNTHTRKIATIEGDIINLENMVSLHSKYISDLRLDVNIHTGNNDIHVTTSDKSKWDNKAEKNHKHKKSDIEDLEPIILSTKSYGSSLPSDAKTGQLFFLTN